MAKQLKKCSAWRTSINARKELVLQKDCGPAHAEIVSAGSASVVVVMLDGKIHATRSYRSMKIPPKRLKEIAQTELSRALRGLPQQWSLDGRPRRR